MTTSTTTSSLTSSDVAAATRIIEVKPGVKYSVGVLRKLLPDVETLLFFGKVLELDYTQLSYVMREVLETDLIKELTDGNHSTMLQDYIVDELGIPEIDEGEINFAPDVPVGEVLPEVWRSLQIEVAQSIKDVAAKLSNTLHLLPGVKGNMVMRSMMAMNKRRPTIGDYRAVVARNQVKENLLILDVSGSMSESTIRSIIADVVALSYEANAHMAVVSNTATHWAPGTYGVDEVLKHCEFGGTQYETLHDLLSNEWGTVITIADYDSSWSAKESLARNVNGGHIDTVIDVSLVNQPTFLSECVGQFADEIRPIMIGTGRYVLS